VTLSGELEAARIHARGWPIIGYMVCEHRGKGGEPAGRQACCAQAAQRADEGGLCRPRHILLELKRNKPSTREAVHSGGGRGMYTQGRGRQTRKPIVREEPQDNRVCAAPAASAGDLW